MKEYEQHEIGKCYPPLNEETRAKLRSNLHSDGPKSKVCLFEDKILDGWHQYLISKEDKLECAFEEVNPPDPVAFVVQRNEGRRHLTDDQRAMIAVELAELKRKAPWRPKNNLSNSRGSCNVPELVESAKQQNISLSRATRARRAKATDPACVEQIRNGKMKIADVVGPLEKAGRGKKGGTSQKPPVSKRPEPVRPQGTPWDLSYKDTGFPVNGTWEEKNAHQKKYGRTPLYPQAVADMIKHSQLVAAYVGALTMAASDSHPSLDQFFTAIDAMLAWVPDREKGKDWAENYAGKATKQLGLLEERLPILLERLTKLQEMLNDRKERLSK